MHRARSASPSMRGSRFSSHREQPDKLRHQREELLWGRQDEQGRRGGHWGCFPLGLSWRHPVSHTVRQTPRHRMGRRMRTSDSTMPTWPRRWPTLRRVQAHVCPHRGLQPWAHAEKELQDAVRDINNSGTIPGAHQAAVPARAQEAARAQRSPTRETRRRKGPIFHS